MIICDNSIKEHGNCQVAGTELNKSAAETYGHEVNELLEEALNRVNSSSGHSFAGNEFKPNFGNSDVLLGELTQSSISLNGSLVEASGMVIESLAKVNKSYTT